MTSKAQDRFDLTGRVAIANGGSRGRRKEIATGQGEASAGVAISARREEALRRTEAELRVVGDRVSRRPGRRGESPGSAIGARRGRAPLRPDRHAGQHRGKSWGAPAQKLMLEQWQKETDTSLAGRFPGLQMAERVFVEKGVGNRIDNVASVAGLRREHPAPMQAIGYHASKGEAIVFTRALAVGWPQYVILVNAIAPDFSSRR